MGEVEGVRRGRGGRREGLVGFPVTKLFNNKELVL